MLRSCDTCGKSYETFPSRVKRGQGKYCSRECGKIGGARNGKGKYPRTTEHRERMSQAVREAPRSDLTGEANHRWIDGRSYQRYGPRFGRRLRRIVVERDKVCRDCGLWKDGPKMMHLHHLNGDTANHGLDNVILLCAKCHRRRHVAARNVA